MYFINSFFKTESRLSHKNLPSLLLVCPHDVFDHLWISTQEGKHLESAGFSARQETKILIYHL